MKVYISHAQTDKKAARELARLLTAKGLEVTYPHEDIFPGDNWALESGKALEKSDAMVVLLSPAATKSEWLQREVSFAVGSSNYKWRLIPINLRPAKEVPWVLTNLLPIPWSADRDLTATKVVERIRHPVQRFKRLQPAKAV